jgi:hypothetical protein
VQGLFIVVDDDPTGFLARSARDEDSTPGAPVTATEDVGIPAVDPEFLARRRE